MKPVTLAASGITIGRSGRSWPTRRTGCGSIDAHQASTVPTTTAMTLDASASRNVTRTVSQM